MINIKNLVKQYRKTDSPAVDNVSFRVKKGEFFAFLGPNGAGKTTTLSVLNTTLAKTAGHVTIAGFDIDRDPAAVRAQLGVIFQQPSLDLNLTAEENVRFHAILYGLYPYRPFYQMMPAEYKERVEELAEVLKIRDDLFRPLKTFSGGMKRKLEIIRSLTHNPQILFLDEPTSGLDPEARRSLWRYLQTVREREDTTIFLTTHYLEEAESADHLAVIHHGQLIFDGTPTALKDELVQHLLIIDADDRQGLKQELKRRKIKFSSNHRIEINLGHQKASAIVQSLDTQLNFLEVRRPTLEDAYLKLIGTDDED